MTTQEHKTATLQVIQTHLANYAQRIAADTTAIEELEKDGNWKHEQAIDSLLHSRDITKAKRVALLSLQHDLREAGLID